MQFHQHSFDFFLGAGAYALLNLIWPATTRRQAFIGLLIVFGLLILVYNGNLSLCPWCWPEVNSP